MTTVLCPACEGWSTCTGWCDKCKRTGIVKMVQRNEIELAENEVIRVADVWYDLTHQPTLNQEALKRVVAMMDKAVQTLRKARAAARELGRGDA